MVPTLESDGVKVFKMIRGRDESGISGKGHVAYGIVGHTGHVVLFWRSDISAVSKIKVSSVGYYDNFDDFLAIHVSSHLNNNDTEIQWVKLVEC